MEVAVVKTGEQLGPAAVAGKARRNCDRALTASSGDGRPGQKVHSEPPAGTTLAELAEHLVLARDDHGGSHRTATAVELSRPPRAFARSTSRVQVRWRSPRVSVTTRPISSGRTRSWMPSDVS